MVGATCLQTARLQVLIPYFVIWQNVIRVGLLRIHQYFQRYLEIAILSKLKGGFLLFCTCFTKKAGYISTKYHVTNGIKTKKYFSRIGGNPNVDSIISEDDQNDDIVKMPTKEELDAQDPFGSIDDDDFDFDIFDDDDEEEDYEDFTEKEWKQNEILTNANSVNSLIAQQSKVL